MASGDTYNLTTVPTPANRSALALMIDVQLPPNFTPAAMKIQADVINAPSISGYGAGWISIGSEKISVSVVIGSRGERFNWSCERFEDLTAEHFAQLAALGTELIVFGSGEHIRFPEAACIKPLIDQQIGIETMDTHAACRTYNILAGEDRHVALAVLLEAGSGEGH